MKNWEPVFEQIFRLETVLGDFACGVNEWFFYVAREENLMRTYFTYNMYSREISDLLGDNI
jgi:hypothetical protein